MGIYPLDIYRSSNVGIFLKANDEYVLVPKGLAPTKVEKLSSFLGVKPVRASVGGSRLLGPLVAMNNNGILLSRLAENEEIRGIGEAMNLPVQRFPSKYTSAGNLIVVNDKGAIVSNLLPPDAVSEIRDFFGVPVEVMSIASYSQVGAMVAATNMGAAVHPRASDEEIGKISSVLGVDVEAATVNGGVPIPASGAVANSQNIIVGNLTTGPELMILSRVFKV